MLSQLNLHFHKKLFEVLKAHAGRENTSVDSQGESFLDDGLKIVATGNGCFQIISDPEATLAALHTLLEIPWNLLVWQEKYDRPLDGHCIKGNSRLADENWTEKLGAFLAELCPINDQLYARHLLRPQARATPFLQKFRTLSW